MKVILSKHPKPSLGIITDQQLKQLKMEHLKKRGFRQDAQSWTNGTTRVRLSLVNDAEIPLSVFTSIIEKSIQASNLKKQKQKQKPKQKPKPKPKPKPKQKEKLTKRRAKRNLDEDYSKQDAMEHRLPGSFEGGKRR